MKKPIFPKAHHATIKSFASFNKFLQIEAVGGLILFTVAVIALIWANSSIGSTYDDLWHTPLIFTLGHFSFSQSLHFWINDVLMTFFFLVVGMEIRQEMHDGSLSNVRSASLPIVAALGGVIAPALIYLSINHTEPALEGWAVPTATDIAFAVGALAILGKNIPANIRIFLLALAIIDDIIAVLIIAFFYSGGLQYSGLLIALVGIIVVLIFQWLSIKSAFAYLIPSAILWFGLYITGVHPSLAGVILGLMTPVTISFSKAECLSTVSHLANTLEKAESEANLEQSALKLQKVQRELISPVTRVNIALHPWVSFGIMPLFALANAGINIESLDLSILAAEHVIFAVMLALVIGKPLGIFLFSFIMVKAGICQLPKNVTFSGILLVGLFGGIGFTMSIFIANLAFSSADLLSAAKAGILIGSLCSIIIGLIWGFFYKKTLK